MSRQPMSSVDAAWLHMERPTNLMMINGFFLFDGEVEFERFKATIENRLVAQFSRFRKRVVETGLIMKSPNWETDERFDINAHVHRVALPSPGDEAALYDMISDLAGTPLDFSKPPWQYHLIEGYGPGTVAFYRLHHCIADGIALMQVMLSMCDTEPDAAQPEPRPARHPSGPLDGVFNLINFASHALGTTRRVTSMVIQEGLETLVNPPHIWNLTRTTASYGAALARLTLLPTDTKTLFKGKLGVSKRVAWSAPFGLDEVKRLCKASGASLNDVMLSVVTGGLRGYMLEREVDPAGKTIKAMMPVNLRDPAKALKELGNYFGLVVPTLPLGEGDPVARLDFINRDMTAIKETPEAVVSLAILQAMGNAPTEVENLGIAFFTSKTSAVITNVPGPTEQLYFAGRAIRTVMGWVPQGGDIGMGISIFSYNGQVVVGIITDEGLVPDPQTIVRHLNAEYGRLREALLHPATVEAEAETETETGAETGAETEAETEIGEPQTRSAAVYCQATTKSGNPCKLRAQAGSEFCHIHGK